MTYTLWRADRLLGHVHIAFPSTDPDLIAGILHPTPDYADIAPVMQTRVAIAAGAPVFRTPLEATSRSGRPSRSNHRVALRAPDPTEAQGVAPESILELRGEHGEVVASGPMAIQRIPLAPGEARGEIAAACAARGLAFSPWMVTARRERRGPGPG
ncbi:MAG TPA: hypothetical protein VFQ38_01075 [Longimicrobiales bacterium]|nr:hypothetical protein [Longimicrobiales bacterium]